TEGVIRPVPLDHHDLVRGIAPLERNGEIEAAGAAAETYRAHGPTRLSLPIYYKPINSKLKAFFEKCAPSSGGARNCAVLLQFAVLGVAVGAVREDFFHDLRLEFAVGAPGDLGEVEVLDRVSVDVELERPPHRRERRLPERRPHRVLV